jgi:hypothetical protein
VPQVEPSSVDGAVDLRRRFVAFSSTQTTPLSTKCRRTVVKRATTSTAASAHSLRQVVGIDAQFVATSTLRRHPARVPVDTRRVTAAVDELGGGSHAALHGQGAEASPSA